jgi:hypothetical protein
VAWRGSPRDRRQHCDSHGLAFHAKRVLGMRVIRHARSASPEATT